MFFNIINVLNPVLKQKSSKVEKIDEELNIFINDLIETMYHNNGAGIASIQVGRPISIIVIVNDDNKEKYKNKSAHMVLINPEITWKSKEAELMEEGCLSVPEYSAKIMRSLEIEVKYNDLSMKEHIIKAGGDIAHRLQHEIDHVNGILYIDYLSKLKRDNVIKKIRKLDKFK